MYTDMFLTEYIILAIHLNSQGALSDVVLNKVSYCSLVTLHS